MIQQRAGRWLLLGATSLVLSLLATAPATAVVRVPMKACPPASVGGKAVGKISVGGVTVPIKKVRMGADGTLDAAPSNLLASVVTDYQPLNAKVGTTVLLWHSRYGVGCDGTLNVFFDQHIGDTFKVTDAKGVSRRYEIAAVNVVPKGKYWADWFRYDGPRQLTVVTCTGLKDGVFTQNYVITAVPA